MFILKTSRLKVMSKIAEYITDEDILPDYKVRNLPAYLIGVFSMIKPLTEHVYLVGGAVRDLILGKEPKDFDLVTDVEPENLIPIFEEDGWTIKEAGEDFKVLHVHKNGIELEIARFRKDLHPDSNQTAVALGDIYDDAVRRDLTVNALYLDPFTGFVHDPSGEALKTIKQDRILKFMGKPEDRIEEDHSRLLRFLRFIEKLKSYGFEPDPESLQKVKDNFHKVKKLDHNRVREELEKMTGLKKLEQEWTKLREPQRYPKTVLFDKNSFKTNKSKVFKFLKVLNRLSQYGYLPSSGSVSTFRNAVEHLQKHMDAESYYAEMEMLAGLIPDVEAEKLEATIKGLEQELETVLQDPRTVEREKKIWDVYKRKQDAVKDYLD